VKLIKTNAKTDGFCVTGCMDGMEVNSKSSESKRGKRICNRIFIDHPDCPVCDQAGECDLQDLSFEHGKGKSRFVEDKRTLNLKILGQIFSYMNRCILCYRCVMVADQLTDNRVHGVG
jgi:NADH-quinone oxidoreductase subunit G